MSVHEVFYPGIVRRYNDQIIAQNYLRDKRRAALVRFDRLVQAGTFDRRLDKVMNKISRVDWELRENISRTEYLRRYL